MKEGFDKSPDGSAGARLTDRAAQILHSLSHAGGKIAMNWVHVAAIVVPLLSGIGTAAALTMSSLKESAAVTDARLDSLNSLFDSRLDAINSLLHELKGGQKSNSDEVISLRGEVDRLTKDIERLRDETVTDDRLQIETVEREALEKRMSDLYGLANATLHKNTARIETLRTYHNKKE